VSARGLGAHRRRTRITRTALIALGVVVFLAISAWLARFLSTENAEREAVVTLLRAQASGNVQAVLAQLHGCRKEASCAATVRRDAGTERRGGSVQILALSSPTAYSLADATGETRVAWRAGSSNPIVQCVLVHRHGNALTGLSVTLLRLSAPIGNEADCP
jgi:hypothetical protein